MAHLNLEEQEQINTLKYFWRNYGKYVIGFLIVVILVYLFSEIWTYRGESSAKEAAVTYVKFVDATESNDTNKIYLISKEMQQKYPNTEYTVFANIWAAKVAFSNKEFDKSANYLKWVIANSKDKNLAQISKLRLVDIYIDQKNIKDALKVTMEKVEPDFQALFYDKRGDLYLATHDKLKATDAYKAAINAAAGNQELIQSIQMKLDILGG